MRPGRPLARHAAAEHVGHAPGASNYFKGNDVMQRRTELRMTTLMLALIATALPLAVPAADAPEGGRFYGMLRSRDLTPFGFLRLDMRPAHAVSIEPHTFAFEAELGYQNTWALSENVEKYLDGARSLGPPRDRPGGDRRPSATCPARTICSTSSPRRST